MTQEQHIAAQEWRTRQIAEYEEFKIVIKSWITEWRKGCSHDLASDVEPLECRDCTYALIDAIEHKLKEQGDK